MDSKGINETLKNHKCLTCNNLFYWDWYMCKLNKHMTKQGFLHMGELKNCDGYEKRVGNKDYCKDKDCIFWCMECKLYPKD